MGARFLKNAMEPGQHDEGTKSGSLTGLRVGASRRIGSGQKLPTPARQLSISCARAAQPRRARHRRVAQPIRTFLCYTDPHLDLAETAISISVILCGAH